MTRRMKIALILLALATGGGGPGDGGGCDCNCDWGTGKPPAHSDNRGQSGWVEAEPSPPSAMEPAHAQDAPAVVADPVERMVNAQLPVPAPRVIKEQTIERRRWPEWYVRRTPGGNMHATWDCNGWARGTNPVIHPGTVVKICGW